MCNIHKTMKIIAILLFTPLLVQCGRSDSAIEKTGKQIEAFYSDTTKLTGEVAVIKLEGGERSEKFDSLTLAPEFKRIKDRGKLIIGMYNTEMPPFFMTDANGSLVGHDVALARDIGKHLEVPVEFDRTSPTADVLMKKLQSGQIDLIISKFSRTFDRLKYISFSNAYCELNQTLIFNKQAAMQLKIENNPYAYLKKSGVKIGVLKGTAYGEYARTFFPKAIIVEYNNWQIINEAFKNKEIIAILYDNNEVMRVLKKSPEVALIGTIYVLTKKKDTMAIGVAQQNHLLQDWLNLYLEIHAHFYTVDHLMKEFPEAYGIPKQE